MKTAELTGAALDWAVAKCEGLEIYFDDGFVCLVGQPFDTAWRCWNPSTDWAQGGPIIEREKIAITGTNFHWWECDNGWYAHIGDRYSHGSTPLEAAMRCYVASKLGDEVEVPEELMTAA